MFKGLFDPGYKELKRCQKIADKVMALEPTFATITDEQIKEKTNEFKDRVQNKGESLDSILPEAFALVREASKRFLHMTPYYVQVCGGIAIHGGNIAEMKTGEGKTLTAVMPAYLNGLSGKGVHIVTVNEYLAAREANGEIGDLFRFLGLSVGLNLREYNSQQKRENYNCDILYSTHAELGFDYLRDHMVMNKEDMVQRSLNCAIIDEIDSILIDEARTPLIISGGQKNTASLYQQADRFAKSLKEEDYEVDIEARTIALTQSGIKKAERVFGMDNLYDLKYVNLVHHMNNALKANYVFALDKEYVVQDGEVLIVDSFTGRILKGRQFSEGLHQAIEAKEGVEIKKETITLATITYQNFFRMYAKLCGMTGTAKTEEEEFLNTYNMYVVEVPTNRPVIRKDEPDYIFVSAEDKFNALIEEVVERHEKGQPVLIGTIAVETSELISDMLTKKGINHQVLNAKQHAREAEIVAHAGEIGAVTIATNMAGRGTDIKLAEGVKELGGLAVIGSERHESRRIDNQLRGRSGRQGDPGYSRFYLSADDDLLQRFGGDSFKARIAMVTRVQGDTSAPLESKMFTKLVSGAQKRIEGNNFDSRKNVLKYDEVMRKQREIIYKQRTDVLTMDDVALFADEIVKRACGCIVDRNVEYDGNSIKIDDEKIVEDLNKSFFINKDAKLEDLEKLDVDGIVNYAFELVKKYMEVKKEEINDENVYNQFLRQIILRVVDDYWTKHIDAMAALKQSVSLESYGHQNPLISYQQSGFEMFELMNENIAIDSTSYFIKAVVKINNEPVNKNIYTNQVDDSNNSPEVKGKKIGRNEPCPCGSGKKYKNCCMGK